MLSEFISNRGRIEVGMAELKDRRVLVTGARGFIGTAVCRVLTSLGADVYGVGRSAGDPGEEACSFTCVDLSDADATQAYFETTRPEFVIHLAGCSVARRDLEWVQTTFRANLVTSVNLLEAAQQFAVEKTVIAGSLEQPDDATANSIPSSPYAASKWAAAGYAKMFHAVYGMQVDTARIFMVYGPGQRELQKMIPYVCLSAIAGTEPSLMSGARLVDWVYIDDVAEGLIRMLLDGPGDGSLIDLGTGQLVSTGDVAGMICRKSATGVSPSIGAIPDRAMEQIRKADVEKTEQQIAWRPRTSLEDGLDETLAWYKQTQATN